MYCIHCGKFNKNATDKCEFCGKELIKRELEHEEIRTLSKSLHNRLNASREAVDNAMVLIVLGSTLFLIGVLFFFLSFKFPNAQAPSKVITITCFEFWVSMAGLGIGGVMLILGLIRLFIQKVKIQKEIFKTLNKVQHNDYVHYVETND
jgi:formate-dependent nitrite reductase membrane component NrfD